MNSPTQNQTMAPVDPSVIVALDYDDINQALAFVDRIDPRDCRLKVGKEMFTFHGPELVKQLKQRGFDVFLDLKFHDIPNTVARAVAAAAEMGVWMVNVHASGGTRMMDAAKEVLMPYGKDAPLLTAVTVLTSMDQTDLAGIGIDVSPAEHAERLALLSKNSGLDGVVCSAHEAAHLKQLCGAGFKLVTPGIRPIGSDIGDQRRIMTPQDAIAAGVDYMVIGRPITRSDSPTQMLKQINESLKGL
ncbi:orotidine-5'-phosphate decarboxylase [Moellerella wisconsensis]|uniref:orotidine-5'-phosphate decarboxylase n=1 Tax=Moellerella wisconsensis TaxID=158849 RepID=UPI0030766A43